MKNIMIAFNLNAITGRDEVVGVLKFARDHPDWNIRIISRSELQDILHSAESKRITGLIASCSPDEALISALAKTSFPCVLLEFPYARSPHWSANVSLMQSDNEAVGRLAAEHFLSLGRFASYAFIDTNKPFKWGRERGKAYRSTLGKAGCFVHATSASPTDDGQDLQRWIKELPKPTAIFAAYDELAIKVLNICKSLHIAIPAQASLLGVDNDILYCEHVRPMLTSIQLNCQEQGYLAAKELARLMAKCGKKSNARSIKVPPIGLIERESTAPLAPAFLLIERAKAYIKEYACTGIKVTDVVAHLGVSRRLADKRFREITGSTIANEIIFTKLTAIESVIKAGITSARKIAKLCGFKNVKYMQNLFRDRHGATIRSWAQQLKGSTSLGDPDKNDT